MAPEHHDLSWPESPNVMSPRLGVAEQRVEALPDNAIASGNPGFSTSDLLQAMQGDSGLPRGGFRRGHGRPESAGSDRGRASAPTQSVIRPG